MHIKRSYNKERAQKFAKKARQSIMGYHILHQQQHNEAQDSSSCSNKALVPIKLEQMVKQFKTHRCTLDFDYYFCKEVFKDTAQAS